MGDPYEILGVFKSDSIEKIKEAYWFLAKKLHPDKNGGVESEEFKRVSWAWSVISDPAKRKQYDEHGTGV